MLFFFEVTLAKCKVSPVFVCTSKGIAKIRATSFLRGQFKSTLQNHPIGGRSKFPIRYKLKKKIQLRSIFPFIFSLLSKTRQTEHVDKLVTRRQVQTCLSPENPPSRELTKLSFLRYFRSFPDFLSSYFLALFGFLQTEHVTKLNKKTGIHSLKSCHRIENLERPPIGLFWKRVDLIQTTNKSYIKCGVTFDPFPFKNL